MKIYFDRTGLLSLKVQEGLDSVGDLSLGQCSGLTRDCFFIFKAELT